MDISRVSVVVRLRGPWEAVDLGFVMAMAGWRSLFWSWLIPSTVLLLLLNAVTLFAYPGACIAAVWWLKPIWDRLPLHIASRQLFGEHVSVRAALRELPRLARRDWLAWLTWRRFSVTRSFDMPLTLLEGLRGAPRARRLQLLHLRAGNAASWLTVVCANFEVLAVLGCIAALQLLVPAEVDVSLLDWFKPDSVAMTIVQPFLAHLAAALVAPFYTMAGFALYISRRIELEGWDIEICFRNLAQRLAQVANPSPGIAAVVLSAVLIAGVLPATRAIADDALDAEQSHSLIQKVLAGEEFHHRVSEQRWRLRSPDPDASEDQRLPEWLIRFLEFLERPGKHDDALVAVARAFKFGLWVVFCSLAIYLAYRYRGVLARMRSSLSGARGMPLEVPPETMFGMDVRSESLPADVIAEVSTLWQAQRLREALALLYRATLAQLIARSDMRFRSGHTEEECVAIVRAAGKPALETYFLELTRVWQQLAYAHRTPSGVQFDALCARWKAVLDA